MPHRCLRPRCKGIYKHTVDGVTVEAGGYPLTDDRSVEVCNVCGRTVEEAWEEVNNEFAIG